MRPRRDRARLSLGSPLAVGLRCPSRRPVHRAARLPSRPGAALTLPGSGPFHPGARLDSLGAVTSAGRLLSARWFLRLPCSLGLVQRLVRPGLAGPRRPRPRHGRPANPFWVPWPRGAWRPSVASFRLGGLRACFSPAE